MKTISPIIMIVTKSIAIVGAAPLLPVVALMWCLALLAEKQNAGSIVNVPQAI